MRLRYWTALVAVVGLSVTIAVREANTPRPSLAAPSAGGSAQDRLLSEVFDDETHDGSTQNNREEGTPPDNLNAWSRAIGPGENLDILLAEAGLDAPTRSDVSRAIGAEYDLRRLKPGYHLSLEIGSDGLIWSATLEVEDGQRVRAVFGDTPSVRTIPPELETLVRAGEAEIATSIYAALEASSIPTRFATDLELILDGTLDLRRAVTGGEHLRIVWRENRLGDRIIGDPIIDYAEIELGEERFEVVWPGDEASHSLIYKDDLLVRTFYQPIPGARLSSSFGLRDHPVHGGIRMHSGIDFAAPFGAEVRATHPGTIAFIGRRSGYGLMVEIEHPRNLRTIYAHLSATSAAIEPGQTIAAGEEIGQVGSTGTSTAPHLHYEIIVDGTPVPPLTDDSFEANTAARADVRSMQMLLDEARGKLTRVLASELPMGSDQDG